MHACAELGDTRLSKMLGVVGHRPLDNILKYNKVEQQLKSVKRNKATALDDLPPGLIKDSAELISAALAHLINFSLKTGIFLTERKTAKVIPTHKSNSYRPISVLPVISKIIEKIIYHPLTTFLDKCQLITNFQYGFRPKLSTEYATTILLDSIRDNVNKGRLVGAIFVDLSKAFDTVSHAMLLDKLPIDGFQGKELKKNCYFPYSACSISHTTPTINAKFPLHLNTIVPFPTINFVLSLPTFV